LEVFCISQGLKATRKVWSGPRL